MIDSRSPTGGCPAGRSACGPRLPSSLCHHQTGTVSDGEVEVEEVPAGQTQRAAEALLALRPRWHTADALINVIDTQLRPSGYRLAGAFLSGKPHQAVAVAGFRRLTALAWGDYLYLDDLSTLPAERGAGHADGLMTWLAAEAVRLGCETLHLDSGVGPDRAPAHRLYMRHRLRISAYHFQRDL